METESEGHQSVEASFAVEVETNIQGLDYDEEPIIRSVQSTLGSEECPSAEITIILVDSEYLRELKFQYFGEDVYTDVIAFRLNPPEEPRVEGEIYISVEQAASQALEYGVTADLEILRLTVHGTLHLLGYEDDTPEGRQGMTAREDHQLDRFSEPLVIRELP